MASLTLETEPVASRVEIDGDKLVVYLEDGRAISVPLAWYPRLAEATTHERSKYEIFAEGTAIEWPLVDEHVNVEGLLAGRRSGESASSLMRWRKEMDRRRRKGALHATWEEVLPLPDWWEEEGSAIPNRGQMQSEDGEG